MKKPNKTQVLDAALGKGQREASLEMNPHGFAAVHKVHKNKKKYQRNIGKSLEL